MVACNVAQKSHAKTEKPMAKCSVNLYAFTHGRSTNPLATIIHPNEAANAAKPITPPSRRTSERGNIPRIKNHQNGKRNTRPIHRAQSRCRYSQK